MSTPRLSPQAIRIMAKMQHLLAEDGIHLTIHDPDAHLKLIEVSERFHDDNLKDYGRQLKELTVYNQQTNHIIRRMCDILSADGIDVDMGNHDAVSKLINYAEHFSDKELKKLGKQLKKEYPRTA